MRFVSGIGNERTHSSSKARRTARATTFGSGGQQNLSCGQLSATDIGMQTVHRFIFQDTTRALGKIAGIFMTFGRKQAGYHFRTQFSITCRLALSQSLTNGCACLARCCVVQPAFIWKLGFTANNFNLVTIFDERTERQTPTVNPNTCTTIANHRMHGIGEVERGRPARQGDKAPLRREAEYLIVEQLKFGIFHELFSRFAGLQLLDHIL